MTTKIKNKLHVRYRSESRMMRLRSLALVAFAAVAMLANVSAMALSDAEPASVKSLTLWFDSPAKDWERESLPIGNGSMGATVQGGVESEVIQFNEKTLWTGGPGSREGYDFGIPEKSQLTTLRYVQRMIAEKGKLAPEAVAQALGRAPKGYGNYQTFGNLVIELESPPESAKVEDYRRELDISNGIAQVSYRRGDVRYTREYFASFPAQVIVARFTASKPGAISLTAGLLLPENRTVEVKTSDARIRVAGELHDNALRYEAQLHLMQQGGTIKRSGEGLLQVVGADSVTFILGAATDYALQYPKYRGEHPHDNVQQRVDQAVAQGYDQLFTAHQRDYRRLFDRVRLDIGQIMPDVPTPSLLNAYRGSGSPSDKALEHLYFQYGRYLLIASSRAGSLPANLQGVWNNSNTPPWAADYHVNINLQMNYWPADVTNLAETLTPYFNFVQSLVEPGEVAAQRFFNADGWTLFLNTNPWGFTGVIEWPTAFWQPEAGAWLARHFYDHYLFTQDARFLREEAYPLMKSAAAFWLDSLVEDANGESLVVNPSFSPEHGDFTEGAAMSQQLVTDLFRKTLIAAEQIGDPSFAKRLQLALERLEPGLRIGGWGQLQEWKQDLDDPDSKHRHVSHLYALYPGDQLGPDTTPVLAKAAKVSLNARGDGGTGWAKAWKINLWARLLDGDRAHKLLAEQISKSTLPNLWSSHPPFQIDGNLGATAGVAEMLLQSHPRDIHLLPALPAVWANTGAVTGLKARGGVEVDISWRKGNLQSACLNVDEPGPIKLRSSSFEQATYSVTNTATGNSPSVRRVREQLEFNAKPRSRYCVERRDGSFNKKT